MHCTAMLRSGEDGFFYTKGIGRLCWCVFLVDCIIDKTVMYSFFSLRGIALYSCCTNSSLFYERLTVDDNTEIYIWWFE
jgi:hypothetical protein